jgi:hypothetical protein
MEAGQRIEPHQLGEERSGHSWCDSSLEQVEVGVHPASELVDGFLAAPAQSARRGLFAQRADWFLSFSCGVESAMPG